ncbi:Effector protein hopD2 [Aquicella siphonis]|uniref:Effector protein hopD2 n=1 Tax=Aquicella siphonis TaxID=254247 RepID=A0A5E4PG13_9COXI|nr:dual specificity protein phosphatase family protein [Aquicella siphonis]VVC75311.1 Effector protein hopD2 [Aquicella siphonis]
MAWARYSQPLLVMDMRNSPELPRHFRTTSDSLPLNVNITGLSELHIAGSGQFSRASLEKAARRLNVKRFTVIDLRQESHGLLNGNAVSWYGPRNAENAGKTPGEIENDQSRLLVDLGSQEIAVVNKILKKSENGEIAAVKPAEYMVHQTTTEEELVTGMGHKYKRIFVQDYHAPTNQQVDRFIAFVRNLPPNQWVYLHCRAGIGRTTVFMVMYDMMRNAKSVSLRDILARQKALGGKDLTQLPARNHFKYQLSVDRLNFIKRFYEYAQTNQDHFQTSWSQWLEKSD